MYCKYCGSKISETDNFCESCGKSKSPIEQPIINVINNNSNIGITPIESKSIKSPGLAVFLSFICCGLGQVYNGDVLKGFIHFILCIIGLCIFIIPGIIIWIYSMCEAYEKAEELNK